MNAPTFEFELPVGDGLTATVTAELEDGPDLSVGIQGYSFNLSAEVDGQPYELTAREEDAANERATNMLYDRRYDYD